MRKQDYSDKALRTFSYLLNRKCLIHNSKFAYFCPKKECIDSEICFLCMLCKDTHEKSHSKDLILYSEIFAPNNIDEMLNTAIKNEGILSSSSDMIFLTIEKLETLFTNLENEVITILKMTKNKTKDKFLKKDGLKPTFHPENFKKIYQETFKKDFEDFTYQDIDIYIRNFVELYNVANPSNNNQDSERLNCLAENFEYERINKEAKKVVTILQDFSACLINNINFNQDIVSIFIYYYKSKYFLGEFSES